MTPETPIDCEDTISLLCEYTRNSRADVLRFIAVAEQCGYVFTRPTLTTKIDLRELKKEQSHFDYDDCQTEPIEVEAYREGWNAALDHLTARHPELFKKGAV